MERIITHPDTLQALSSNIIEPLLDEDKVSLKRILDACSPSCIADLAAPFDYDCLQPLSRQITRLKYLSTVVFDYCAMFKPVSPLSQHQWNMLKCVADRHNKAITWSNDKQIENLYKELFDMLWPHDLKGENKVRIGGDRDGGYVFIDPKQSGIAYSFGVSSYSPWDLEMAQRGYKVYQFDGTIKNAPDKHPNLRFIPKNIVGSTNPKPNEKNINQIFSDLGHENETDIILQIDIEGGEWDFFENIEESQIMKFGQIIAEFHGLHSASFLPRAKKILSKICKTHIPVHLHYNNVSNILGFPNFLVGDLFEISFVSKLKGHFNKTNNIFPSLLDKPNVSRNPEIYIGSFEDITEFGQLISTPPPPPPPPTPTTTTHTHNT